MLTAIAIDDEPQALEVVRLHAAKVPFLDLKAAFTDAFEAIPYLQKNKIDLIFLDIKMPDISGIEFVNCLQTVPMVVFTTAYSDYAVQGFELDAIDYLLKPFPLARFLKSCNKALDFKNLRENSDEEFIFVKTGYEEEKVWLDDILYLEADGNYVTFVLKNRKLLSRQTMSDSLRNLPENQFIRVHRSYSISFRKIEKIARSEITVASVKIPVGASYEDRLTEIKARLSKS
ncbi:LytR/AlgR family response regulator transcription factor [Larkinella rosea]|uniref:DNA-binding response regulator n=1 Tax=Larkinella rosea TaxID=2025312 RepID=A0A3P1BNS0_9BACT|nr:LytTR family DNA-binding domain-containing protein [Larkinella rosea]RRB02134.1 DNA-binding response regulator [Larkinella rosea]